MNASKNGPFSLSMESDDAHHCELYRSTPTEHQRWSDSLLLLLSLSLSLLDLIRGAKKIQRQKCDMNINGRGLNAKRSSLLRNKKMKSI